MQADPVQLYAQVLDHLRLRGFTLVEGGLYEREGCSFDIYLAWFPSDGPVQLRAHDHCEDDLGRQREEFLTEDLHSALLFIDSWTFKGTIR